VDWVLYLDTNVLYSLLDLHSHPENDSCKALLQLIRDNQDHIKIKLRYSDITYKELGYKKGDFELLDDKLTDNAVKALLKSDNIDGFSKKFYENLLHNREQTIHPSEVVELSQTTLKSKTIEIARNAKRIENIGENYISTRIQDFFSFITKQNTTKLEFCTEKKIPFHPIEKSEKQVKHDITLRELILHSRSKVKENEEVTLNSIKYFAVTLDDLLIRFDRYQLRDYNDERSFPVFFKPSFLLNKLVRVLPIKTDDYQKAFIKAVTSKGFHKESVKSRDVLKIVNYLKSQGIDDERVIYNIISQDIFLEKYQQKSKEEGFNQGEFIQSELNREFQAFQEKLEKTKAELSAQAQDANNKLKENQKLEAKKSLLESDLEQYDLAIKKLRKRVKQLEETKSTQNTQPTLNFDLEDEKLKSDTFKIRLKSEIESQIDLEKISALKVWQKRVWWNLFWVIPLMVLAIIIVIPSNIILIESQNERFGWASIVFAPVIIIFLLLIRSRYWDEGNKLNRKKNHIVSQRLQNKLNEFNDKLINT
jgi:hypothetical protein